MWYKNPKIWGVVIAMILGIVGALTGSDFKKIVCGEASVFEQVKE